MTLVLWLTMAQAESVIQHLNFSFFSFAICCHVLEMKFIFTRINSSINKILFRITT